MTKPDTAAGYFDKYNCAQSVFAAYAPDFGVDKDTALSIASGFGAGIGRLQETCGAVTGAVMILGLASRFKEADGREKVGEIYTTARRFTEEFKKTAGTIKCRELINCDLLSEDGQKFFKENNLKEKCKNYVRLACEILDKFLAENK